MNLKQELQARYDFLVEKYGESSIFGVFLYGSQNYNFETPASDVDTKAIYVPSLYEIAANKQPISKELHYSDGSHVEVKDIRLFAATWLKQNINFVEVLFTEHYILNPFYKKQFEKLQEMREEIAYYDIAKTLISVSCQALNTIKHKEVVGKKFANAARLEIFLTKYLQKLPYLECITMTEEERTKFLPYKSSEIILDEEEPEVVRLREQFKLYSSKEYHAQLSEQEHPISGEQVERRQQGIHSKLSFIVKEILLVRERLFSI